MDKHTLADWQYSDYQGYSKTKEHAALSKLIQSTKISRSFDDAKFTYEAAAYHPLDSFYDIEKEALQLASIYSKKFDEHLFVAINSERGTPQYEKAITAAAKKATCKYDMECVGKINSGKTK
jgi:hypothetical protein